MTDNRRERGRRNRAALLDAALELFQVNGFDTTTVEQIAERARVSPRTFFHHFPTKEDVLFDGYAERLSDVARRLRSGLDRSLWSAMADGAAAVATAIMDDPHRYLARARLYEEVPALRARMLLINEEWIDAVTAEVAWHLGTDPEVDLRPRLVATLVNGANRVAIQTWSATGGGTELSLLIADSISLLKPAIDMIEQDLVRQGTGRVG